MKSLLTNNVIKDILPSLDKKIFFSQKIAIKSLPKVSNIPKCSQFSGQCAGFEDNTENCSALSSKQAFCPHWKDKYLFPKNHIWKFPVSSTQVDDIFNFQFSLWWNFPQNFSISSPKVSYVYFLWSSAKFPVSSVKKKPVLSAKISRCHPQRL